jgi:hypothetical protein
MPLQVVSGRGKIRDSGLNLTEVLWVGPECHGVFAGSPSLVKVASADKDTTTATWILSHDFFGATTFNDTVQVYRSVDEGLSWHYLSNVSGIYWANLFSVGNSAIYMVGTDGDDIHRTSPPNKTPLKGGPVVISKSTDGGSSWAAPVTILQGSFQTAPTPAVLINGRYYRAMEDSAVPADARGCGAFVMWADASSDLTLPASWSRSNALSVSAAAGAPGVPASIFLGSWQEGNVVEAPTNGGAGEVWNILRVNDQTAAWNNKAAIIAVDRATSKVHFKQFVDGPFGSSKFVVRKAPSSMPQHKSLHLGKSADGSAPTPMLLTPGAAAATGACPASGCSNCVGAPDGYCATHCFNDCQNCCADANAGNVAPRPALLRYYAVSTNITQQALAVNATGARNNLVFSFSADLVNWSVCKTVLRDDSGFTPLDSTRYTGFEYPDFQFDGSDIVVAVRTAYRGAVSSGSSNRVTFVRIVDYRTACEP